MSGNGEQDTTDGGWRRWRAEDAATQIAIPGPADDKYTRGVLGVITGSDQYPGAAVLGVEAAIRAGVGMVRYVGGPRASDLVLQRRPEVVTGSGRVQAWLTGSGLDRQTRDDRTTAAILRALEEGVPAVIDSGALDLVDRLSGPSVITPHFRELSFVLGRRGVEASAEEIADRASYWAQRSSELLGQTVLLKGHTTFVASPGGLKLSVSLGPSWLATAGSGDVLGGILGALVATHSDELADDPERIAFLAATASALHGLAAERASSGGPIAALDIADSLPGVVATLLSRV
jgi:hydroxyethylthiazole kinase-like uncharacterized protein yjeF